MAPITTMRTPMLTIPIGPTRDQSRWIPIVSLAMISAAKAMATSPTTTAEALGPLRRVGGLSAEAGDVTEEPLGCGPEAWGPEGWGAEVWGPEAWRPVGWGPEAWGAVAWGPLASGPLTLSWIGLPSGVGGVTGVLASIALLLHDGDLSDTDSGIDHDLAWFAAQDDVPRYI